MIFEDLSTGLTVLAGLLALIAVCRGVTWAMPNRRDVIRESPMDVVVDVLKDVDDVELQSLAPRLDRLPRRQTEAAARVLARHLVDWNSGFDDRARQAFVDLAKTLIASYDRPNRQQGAA